MRARNLKIVLAVFWVVLANINFAFAQNIDVETYLKREIINKTIKEYPNLAEKDIAIIIKNREILDKLPNNSYSWEVDLTKIKSIVGTTVISLKIYDNKKQFLDKKNVIIKVNAKCDFIAAARDIKSGEIITEELLNTVYKDMYGKPKTCFFDKKELLGKQAKIFIAKNSLITDYAIRNKPLINEGDRIIIMGETGKIKLEFDGIAINNGSRGEQIFVKSKKFKKKLKGEVIDSQHVKVKFYNN